MHPHPPYEPPDPYEDLPEVPGPYSPQEPVLTVGGVTMAATAILALIVTAVPISDAAQTQILVLIGLVAPFIVTWASRSRVFAPRTVAKLVAAERQKTIQGR